MQLTLAAAAFDPRGAKAQDNAKAACDVAARHGCDLIVLPGCSWLRKDVARISRETGNLFVCARCADDGGAIFRAGEARLVQASLYGPGERGADIALLEVEGVTVALLAEEDAKAPQAARLAALRGAQLLLCPVQRDETDAGPWAQAQQNGVFATVAPAHGEARVLGPLSAHCPDGVLARGREGTMAIAGISLVDWARTKLSFDPLGVLNRPFAAAMPKGELAEVPAAPLKVAAVQRKLRFQEGRKGLIARMDALCAQAKAVGCGLIAFPEYNWLDALGSVPFIAGIAAKADRAAKDAPVFLKEGDEEALATFFPDTSSAMMPLFAAAAFRMSAKWLARVAVRETKRLAKEHGLVVHGGTFLRKRRKKYYNTAVIAFPDGGAVFQDKLHPTRLEMNMGISPGGELSAFEIQGALCCAPVCMDATYYEPFAAARKVGCDIAIVPIFNAEPYYGPAARRGAWARAVENAMYIVKPALTGLLLGELHTGYAGIYGPQKQPLAHAKEPVGDELVTATLDFEALRQTQSLMPQGNAPLEATLRTAVLTRPGRAGEEGGAQTPVAPPRKA